MNRKAIGPVIASALLLVVAVVAVVGFQTWFNNYSSNTFNNVEIRSSNSVGNSNLEAIIGTELYVKNSNSVNISVTKLQIGGVDCNITQNLSPGMSTIDISLCVANLTGEVQNVVLITSNKGVESKTFYIKGLVGPSSCSDSNLIASNIKSGVTICSIVGSYVGDWSIIDNDSDGYVSNLSSSGIISFFQTFYSTNADCDDNNVSINDATDNTCDGDGDGYIDSTAGGIDNDDNNPFLTSLPKNCNDWLLAGNITNGIYSIDPDGLGGNVAFNAYCDMTTDGGGWTRIMYLPNGVSDLPTYTNSLSPQVDPNTAGLSKAYFYVEGLTIKMCGVNGSLSAYNSNNPTTFEYAIETNIVTDVSSLSMNVVYINAIDTAEVGGESGRLTIFNARGVDYMYYTASTWRRSDSATLDVHNANVDSYVGAPCWNQHVWIK